MNSRGSTPGVVQRIKEESKTEASESVVREPIDVNSCLTSRRSPRFNDACDVNVAARKEIPIEFQVPAYAILSQPSSATSQAK
jgi:hypothetical protein